MRTHNYAHALLMRTYNHAHALFMRTHNQFFSAKHYNIFLFKNMF